MLLVFEINFFLVFPSSWQDGGSPQADHQLPQPLGHHEYSFICRLYTPNQQLLLSSSVVCVAIDAYRINETMIVPSIGIVGLLTLQLLTRMVINDLKASCNSFSVHQYIGWWNWTIYMLKKKKKNIVNYLHMSPSHVDKVVQWDLFCKSSPLKLKWATWKWSLSSVV